MKKYLLIFLLIPAISFSQLIQDYTAQEGYSAALAAAESELTQPVLTAIVVNIGLDFSVATIEYNEQTGESNVFAYVFYEGNDKSQAVLVPIVKTFNQYLDARTFPGVPEIPQSEYEDLIGEAISETWADSGVFASVMNNSSEHNDLKAKYPEAELEIVGLITNGDPDSPDFGKSFWGYQYTDEDGFEVFFCAMDVIATDNTFCEVTQPSIVEITPSNAVYGPNPAKENYKITMDVIDNTSNVSIIDIYGNSLPNYLVSISGKTVNINTSKLSQGTYFVNLQSASGNYISKFIKSE